MENGQPYLSVVVTARNDDHGGNLLGRMQIFVSGWIAQSRRFDVPSELIIVEWNPPQDRPRLREVLQWPDDPGPCEVRFIEVSPELHGRYRHAEALPLYQMIAKNVGIRRARGRFILATNIDILFSDELMSFIAERRLQPGKMYRIDRYDAMSDVPMDATVEEQLAWCSTHLLRVNAREGTFPVTPEGRPSLAEPDIAPKDSGVCLGRGWFPVERWSEGEIFRWVDNNAEIELVVPESEAAALQLELEPGPGMGHRVMQLQVCEDSQVLFQAEVERRSNVRIVFPAGGPTIRRIALRIVGGGDLIGHDPRVLNFRVFSCCWEHTAKQETPAIPASPAPQEDKQEEPLVVTVTPVPARRRAGVLWSQIQHLISRMAHGGPLVTVTIPVSRPVAHAARFYVDSGGFTGMAKGGFRQRAALNGHGQPATIVAASVAEPTPEPAVEPAPAPPIAAPVAQEATLSLEPKPLPPAFLHTNGCGDFTLIAREHWFDLRGYPEFDLFSMNIDSVFCYAAHHGGAVEEMLPEPMRIYHIEHGSGSGWTPEGQARLFARIAAKGLSFVSYQDVIGWAAQMRRLNCPMIFNDENWGLAQFTLEETSLSSSYPCVGRAGEPE